MSSDVYFLVHVMRSDAVESIVSRVMANESFRADVKLCLGSMGEEQTIGRLREILKAAPCAIDFEEWAVQIKTRKSRLSTALGKEGRCSSNSPSGPPTQH